MKNLNLRPKNSKFFILKAQKKRTELLLPVIFKFQFNVMSRSFYAKVIFSGQDYSEIGFNIILGIFCTFQFEIGYNYEVFNLKLFALELY